ncbi:transposase family protein [Streptomyces sp. NPDC048275]|uniref:transposase family protein n=1 Tax=Streptomyces sp. NPDC048275 TaxID=3155629 RepID=UPI0033E7F6E7
MEKLSLQTGSVAADDAADLRQFLGRVPDPRGRRGRRYPALALLCAAVAAVLAGARSLIAISEWLTDAPRHVLGVLGFAADPTRSPESGRCRTQPPSTACCSTSTATRWTRRSARICRPESRPRYGRNRNSRRCGRSRSTARPCAARAPGRHGHPTAGRDGPPRRGPGPAADLLQEQRNPFLPTPAGRHCPWRTPC